MSRRDGRLEEEEDGVEKGGKEWERARQRGRGREREGESERERERERERVRERERERVCRFMTLHTLRLLW